MDLESYLRDGGTLQSVKLYSWEIGNIPLLTPEEEQELGRGIEKWVGTVLSGMLNYDQSRLKSSAAPAEPKGLDFLQKELLRLNYEPHNDGTQRGRRYVEREEYQSFCSLIQVAKEQEYALSPDSIIYKSIFELICYTVTRRCLRQAAGKLAGELALGAEGALGMEEATALKHTLQSSLQKDQSIVRKFAEQNQRLVRLYAKRRYRKRMHSLYGIGIEDAIQEGNLGLLECIDRFDYRKGNHFASFVSHSIHSKITRLFVNQGQLIRIPEDKAQLLEQYVTFQQDFFSRHGSYPSMQQTADSMNLNPDTIATLHTLNSRAIPLEHSSGNDEHSAPEDILASNDISPEDRTVQAERQAHLALAMHRHLPWREETILRQRYGFDEPEIILEDLGKKMYCTRERIRQLQSQGQRKLARSKELRALL